MEAGGEVQKAKTIEISAAWEAELRALPYLSQKSGKTIHLLKSSSKAIAGGKKRKKIPVLGSIKHYKESKKIVVDATLQQQAADVARLDAAAEDLKKKKDAGAK